VWASGKIRAPKLYDWWVKQGRYMNARDSLSAAKQFILALHPDKLVPMPGTSEVTDEQRQHATAAVTEANLVREWIKAQGILRGEL
jgi:hydroxypyruvate isomerase